MAPRIIPIALFCLCALFSFVLPQDEGGGESALWLEREHDFGVIEESGGKVSCMMRLVNTCDSAISILDIRATCGCTAVKYSRSPIAPGDTSVITLVFNPYGRPGEFAKSAIVRLSAPPTRNSLILRGTVKASGRTLDRRYPTIAGQLRLSNHILPIGEIAIGSAHDGILSAYNSGNDTLRLSAHNIPHPLSVKFSPELLPPGREGRISVTFDASKCPDSIGVQEYSLSIAATPLHPTDSSTMSTTKLKVVANVRRQLSTGFSAF